MVYPHSYRTEHSETKTTNSIYGEYYANLKSKKIKIQPVLLKLLQYVDSNRTRFLDDVAEAVAFKSISGSLKYMDDVNKFIKFIEKWLVKLDIKYECFKMGHHTIDGQKVKLPSAILASLGRDSHKKTICIYTYLDVREPDTTKWVTDPWTVTTKDNCFYGAGVASGKGVLLAWFHVIQAFQDSNMELPVNLKFVIESMFHQNSTGLAEFVALRKHDFMANIDYIIVCESEWLGEKHPAIIYGTIGILHFDVFMEKNGEACMKQEMGRLFGEICGEDERVLLPEFYDAVTQITPEEEMIYENIQDFNIDEARRQLPERMQDWDQVKLLMHFWRLPSIYVDDIEECQCDAKDESVIKRHFILKIVPRQIIDKTTKDTIRYIQEELPKKLEIEHKVRCELTSSTRYWTEDTQSKLFQAARRATIQIYKEDPNMIREDRDRVVLTIFDRILERNIVLLPLANKGSNVGGDNENFTKKNFFECRKLLAAFLFQIDKSITK